MGMTSSLTQIIQTVTTLLMIFILAITIIIPLWALNKAKKRKEENISDLQNSTFDAIEENNPITEGERKTLIGMATLIKIIIGIITIIVIIYPIIVLLSIFNK